MNICAIRERIKEIDKNLQSINDCYNNESIEDDIDIIGEICGFGNEEDLIKEKIKLLISLKKLERERDLKTFKKG